MPSRSIPVRLLAALPAASMVALLATACGSEDSETPTATEEPCAYPESSRPASKEVDPPPGTPTETDDVSVTISTNVGDLDAQLDASAAPCTVNSFLSLAEQGFFEDTGCHRLTTQGIFVLQCGDPTETGSGGPGYSFDDEVTGEEQYGAGTLAMANAGPDTNGSQFFIVYEDSSAGLDPLYNVFGQLEDDALADVRSVAESGTDTGQPDGRPNTAVEITGVTSR